jgi:Rod binding domain-containing protein
MSIDLGSFSSMPVIPSNFSIAPGANQAQRIEQVSRALEGVFVGQLMAEMGKGITGDEKQGGEYQGFIQQAMTQQVTTGGGFGLAKFIEDYLTRAAATESTAKEANAK